MSRPANIYEFLDDDSNAPVQKGPVGQQQKPKTAQTTQPKATQQASRAPAARTQDTRKPREEGRFSDQPVSERKPRGGERKPRGGGEFTEVRAPRNPNQRQYDRKSGTGRGRENKRAGGGRGNWGSVGDETKNTEEVEKTETTEAPQTEAAPAEAPVEAVEEKVEEEEEKVKTLDEYLNSIKKVNISLPAPRQAGEGQEVSPQWATYTPLKRDEEEEEEKKTEKKKSETKETSKQTISADQVIHFKESPKGSFRGGRGGRGGRREGSERSDRPERTERSERSPRGSPRGGRGGGKRGGGAPGARAPGLTEENFPALKA